MTAGRGRVACWRQVGGPTVGAVGVFPGKGLGLGATAMPVGQLWGIVPLLAWSTVVTGRGLARLLLSGGGPYGLVPVGGPGTGVCSARGRVGLPCLMVRVMWAVL